MILYLIIFSYSLHKQMLNILIDFDFESIQGWDFGDGRTGSDEIDVGRVDQIDILVITDWQMFPNRKYE